MNINTTTIDREEYPELDLLLWDNHAPTVTGQLAFEVYERKWPYVDVGRLGEREKELIFKLTERYGMGTMLTA